MRKKPETFAKSNKLFNDVDYLTAIIKRKSRKSGDHFFFDSFFKNLFRFFQNSVFFFRSILFFPSLRENDKIEKIY